MIDKADFRVVAGTQFTREFKAMIHDSEKPGVDQRRTWSKTKGYQRTGNFTNYGLPVMVHLDCEMTEKRNHKVEILQTGEKTYSEIVEMCSRIFEGEPQNWGLLRADLTCDVRDVPVRWFKENTYIKGKQTLRDMGVIEAVPFMEIRKGVSETIYAGVKPNQMRIYDKVGERRERYSRLARKHVAEAKKILMEDSMVTIPLMPSFQEMFACEPDDVITRVERQVANRDLEKLGLATMFSLKSKAPYLSPFKSLRFLAENDYDLTPETWGLSDWCVGMQLQAMIRERGVANTRAFIKQLEGKNFLRRWQKFQPFIMSASKSVGITAANLQGSYESSTFAQMAA